MNLPFLASPGLDPDAWRILLAARYIAEHHSYVASRLPGYPVPELVLSLFANSPAWVSISVSFLVALGGFFSFYKVLECAGVKDRLLLTVAFALTPVVLINCLTVMDYLWAISFALFSILLIARKQYLVAGLFLGVAVGCRITTALMMIPFCFFIWSSENGRQVRVKECLLFLLSTLIVSMVCYGPVVSTYGLSFLQHSSGGTIRVVNLAKSVSIDTFGIIGMLAVIAALVLQVAAKRRRGKDEPSIGRKWVTISWLVVVVFGILFLWLPLEAGYLIPVVPFLLMLAWFYLSTTSFKTLAYGVIISSFLVSVDSKDRPWSAPPSPASFRVTLAGRVLAVDFLYGPLTLDFLKRKSQLAYGNSIITWAHAQPDSAVLVAGVWLPQLTYLANGPMSRMGEEGFHLKNTTVLGLLNKDQAATCQRMKLQVFYLPGQDRYTNEVYGFELKEFGGKELESDHAVL
jgi:hypothetical protein